MNKLLLIILVLYSINAYSQDWPVKKQVEEMKARQLPQKLYEPFTFGSNKQLQQRGTYQQLTIDAAFNKQIFAERPALIRLRLPVSNTESVICDLVKFELGNIKFTANDKEVLQDITMPVTYRGVVVGETEKNNVVLTVNEDYLSLIATFSTYAIQVTRADLANPQGYRLYNSKSIQFPVVPFDCGTKEESSSALVNAIQSKGYENRNSAPLEKCVNVFVDCFDSLYQWQGSNMQQTINYVTELFNAVATGYLNEQIKIQITTINIWTTPDPFRGDNRENALADLAGYYKEEFWGNICVGLDYSLNSPKGRSGIAGDIGRVKAQLTNTCLVYTEDKNPCCYCDMNYNVSANNFPVGPNTTSQQIYLTMHEIGHLLGAHHTKWCGWKLTSNPDTYGTLDSCGAIEGSCPQGPPPPATGSTIMSYCVSGNKASDFVNYNNGFGLLPGNAIRNFVDQSACIPKCLACLIKNDGPTHTLPFKGNFMQQLMALNEQTTEVPYSIAYDVKNNSSPPVK